MRQNHTAPSIRPAARLTTEVLAEKFGVRPQTPRAGYCRDRHYLGLVPIKLANRRLLWDADEADALLAGRPAKMLETEAIDTHFARKAADAGKVLPHIRAKSEAKAKRIAAGEVAK